jgi:hypothetical protein
VRQDGVETEAEIPAVPFRLAARLGIKPKLGSRQLYTGLNILFGCMAMVFFALAIIGTVRNYSPVPFWDMWDDYVLFYLKIHAGQWNALWALHAEHRIILARLIFWIDFAWFHGNGIFSLFMIYLLVAAVVVIFRQIWKARSQGQDLYILFFVTAWIFSWSQRENLIWAFQSQFILAQLLPLAALYLQHLSYSKQDKTNRYFCAAMFCGVLAVGSMANGMLALPAMAVYSFIIERRSVRTALLLLLSAGEVYFYFQHFSGSSFPGAAPTLTGEIVAHPGEFVQFVLMYLGNPVIVPLRISGFERPAIRLGEFIAILFIAISTWSFYTHVRQTRRSTLSIALLLFMFYIIATAAITAAGRLPLGLDEALSSRYVTPVIYGWAAALLLFWPAVAKSVVSRNIFSLCLAAFLCFILFPRQLQAMASERGVLFQREFAALALELKINDVEQLKILYPNTDTLRTIASEARSQHLSIFGIAPIANAHLLLGQTLNTQSLVACAGHLDDVAPITGAADYFRVGGWLLNARPVNTPKMIYLVDSTNKIVGLGLIGAPRGEAVGVAGRQAKYSGFNAYLFTAAIGKPVFIASPINGCEVPLASVG